MLDALIPQEDREEAAWMDSRLTHAQTDRSSGPRERANA